MTLSDMCCPRQLEADGSDGIIRRALTARTVKLRTGSKIDVPVITLSEPLKTALQKARLQGRIRYGMDPIFEKLAGEKKGLLMSGAGQTPPMEIGSQGSFYFQMTARNDSIAASNRYSKPMPPDCSAAFWTLTATPWVN